MKTTITIVCVLIVLSGIALAVLSHPASGVYLVYVAGYKGVACKVVKN